MNTQQEERETEQTDRHTDRAAQRPADVIVDIQQIIRHCLHRQLVNNRRDWIKAAVDKQQLRTIFTSTL